MSEEQLIYSYDRHKKEAKKIITRITHRQYEELQRSRSEGFQIVEDLKEELRKSYQRTQTEKITKRIRLKKMSEHYQKCIGEDPSQFKRPTWPRLKTKLITQKLTLVKNNFQAKSRRTSKKHSTFLQQIQIDKLFVEVADSLEEKSETKKSEENSSDQEEKIDRGDNYRKEEQQSQQESMSAMLTHYKQNKTFLPMLELYVEQRHFLKTMSQKQQRTRSIITQMLLLALARKQNKKLLDSLDILIDIDSFFPKSNHQMQQLKSAWYQLIATVFMEIKEEETKGKGNKWKAVQQRSSIKTALQMRRQKTIMIRSLASQRNFFDRVTVQLKKMELIHESSYDKECKDFKNVVKASQQGKIVVSKITQNSIISYPQPKLLFSDIDHVLNYGMVFINRDKETNLFPNHYPLSLSSIIPQQKYIEMFCKINSVLVPETKCFSFNTSLNLNYSHIFLIVFLLFLTIVLLNIFLRKSVSTLLTYFILFISLIFLAIFCLRMHQTSYSSSGHSRQSQYQIKQILQEWQEEYQGSIKFTVSEFAELVIISYPKEIQSESTISEQSENDCGEHKLTLPQKLKTLRCSSNSKFLEEIQKILENDKCSSNEKQISKEQSSYDLENRQFSSITESSDSIIDNRQEAPEIKITPPLFLEFQQDSPSKRQSQC